MGLARVLFTRGVSTAYVAAFASALEQWPGLHGHEGLFPVQRPLASLSIQETHVSVVAALVAGFALSCACAVLPRGNPGAPAMLALPLLYAYAVHIARTSDSPFYNFLWDTLLVECGLIGALWGETDSDEEIALEELETAATDAGGLASPRSVAWALRFLAFKLMFMSGMSKLSSRDPVWRDGSALRYHLVSQPLPTPLAWAVASRAPEWLLCLASHGALWLEIVCPILILSSSVLHRRVAFAAQVSLMLGIAATGNYNFFNLLTCVLMAPLLDAPNPVPGLDGGATKSLHRLSSIFFFILVMVLTFVMFEPSKEGSLPFALRGRGAPHATVQTYGAPLVVGAVGWSLFMVGWGAVRDVVEAWRVGGAAKYLPVRAALGVICFMWVCLSAVPMMLEHAPRVDLPPRAVEAYRRGGHHVVSGYGLFRSITGVGPNREVQVPALFLEVSDESDESAWRPLSFHYYPSGLESPLRWVAPRAPRLDWQMWFAALQVQHSSARPPEFLRLFMNRILLPERSRDVLELLPDIPTPRFDRVRVRYATTAFAPAGSEAWWSPSKGSSSLGTTVYTLRRESAYVPVRATSECRPSLARLCDVAERLLRARLAVMSGVLGGFVALKALAAAWYARRDRESSAAKVKDE